MTIISCSGSRVTEQGGRRALTASTSPLHPQRQAAPTAQPAPTHRPRHTQPQEMAPPRMLWKMRMRASKHRPPRPPNRRFRKGGGAGLGRGGLTSLPSALRGAVCGCAAAALYLRGDHDAGVDEKAHGSSHRRRPSRFQPRARVGGCSAQAQRVSSSARRSALPAAGRDWGRASRKAPPRCPARVVELLLHPAGETHVGLIVGPRSCLRPAD